MSKAYVAAFQRSRIFWFIMCAIFVWTIRALRILRTKVLDVVSLNDLVVPVISGLFTRVFHTLILLTVYIDDDTYW